MTMASQIIDMKSLSNFFWQCFISLVKFSYRSNVNAISLWQFSIIRDWLEIWKVKIPLFEFCAISGDWENLAQMCLMKLNICVPSNIKKENLTVALQNYVKSSFNVLAENEFVCSILNKPSPSFNVQQL